MDETYKDKMYDERFARDLHRIEAHEAHMDEQDKERQKLTELTIRMGELLDRHDEKITEHEKRLDEIEKKPGKRWELVVDKIVTLLVAAAVAYFTAK